MKKISYYLILLFVGLIFFSSCGNEPLEGEFAVTQSDDVNSDEFCDNSRIAVTDALADVLAASDEERQELCDDLRETIITTINTCGDDDEGFFQGLLNDLGDDCII